MESLGLIPARGGSKGIPNKNLVELGGRPLISWTIRAALASKLSRVVVSTDSPEIRDVCVRVGVEVMWRPEPLAADDSPIYLTEIYTLDALRERGYEPDVFIRLQPTSPFRSAADINTVLVRFEEYPDINAVIGMRDVVDHPVNIVHLDPADRVSHLMGKPNHLNRQNLPEWFGLNGAFYASRVKYFRENCGHWGPDTFAYVMPKERSFDIDDEFDLKIARALVGGHIRRDGRFLENDLRL